MFALARILGQIFSGTGISRRIKKFRKAKKVPASESGQTKSDGSDSYASASGSPPESQYQPVSKLMDIPLDVIVMIFNILEVDGAVALSLACKGLHTHLFAGARNRFHAADKDDKHKVQTMLEKDLPDGQIYCPFCRTFHTLDKDYRKTTCLEKDRHEQSTFARYVPEVQPFRLRYLNARAIMNAAHFNKPSVESNTQKRNGGEATLETLRHFFKSGTPENEWWQGTTPRVIGGELYLKVFTQHRRELIPGEKDYFTFNVCKHVRVHGCSPLLWAHNSELSRVCHFYDKKSASATCDTCRADWSLRVEWVDEEKEIFSRSGWTVTIVTWHRLGGLRSPDDPLWAESAGEVRSSKKSWIHGDSFYLTDHDNWERDMELCSPADYDLATGPAQRTWKEIEELEKESA